MAGKLGPLVEYLEDLENRHDRVALKVYTDIEKPQNQIRQLEQTISDLEERLTCLENSFDLQCDKVAVLEG